MLLVVDSIQFQFSKRELPFSLSQILNLASVDCAPQLELWVSIPQDGEEEAYKKGNNTLGSCNAFAFADKSDGFDNLSSLVACPTVPYSLNPSWTFLSSAVMYG